MCDVVVGIGCYWFGLIFVWGDVLYLLVVSVVFYIDWFE